MPILPIRSSDASTPREIDRRQVLRAGVWAAPVIVLATAAPAAAVSAAAYQLQQFGPTFFFFGWSDTGQRTGIVGSTTVAVDFHSDAATISGINLIVQLTATGLGGNVYPQPAQFLQNPGGFWSSSLPSTVDANTISYTLTWSQTLNTAGTLNTGILEFAFLTQPGVDLTPLIPIDWSMTATAVNANPAAQNGSMVTAGEFDPRIQLPPP